MKMRLDVALIPSLRGCTREDVGVVSESAGSSMLMLGGGGGAGSSKALIACMVENPKSELYRSLPTTQYERDITHVGTKPMGRNHHAALRHSSVSPQKTNYHHPSSQVLEENTRLLSLSGVVEWIHLCSYARYLTLLTVRVPLLDHVLC